MITLKKQLVNNNELGLHGYCARVFNHGTLSLDDAVALMSLHNTVTRADALAVIAALRDLVTYDLANGLSVNLGDIGTLQLRVSSEGTETQDEWNIDKLKSTNVRYVPSVKLKETIRLGAEGISLRMA